MKINKIINLFVIITFFLVSVTCKTKQEHNKQDNWEHYKVTGDSIMASVTEKDMLFFAQTQRKEYKEIPKLADLNEDYLSLIKIIITKKLLIYTESPYSESGDWNNEYISYYDTDGDLKVFIRKSSFFNSVCVDGILREKDIYSFSSNKLIKKSHEVYDEDMNPVTDTSKCVFNYRFKFDVYDKYSDIPVVQEYEKLKQK